MIHTLLNIVSLGVAGSLTVLLDDWFGYRRHCQECRHFDDEGEALAWLKEQASGRICVGRGGFWGHRRTKW